MSKAAAGKIHLLEYKYYDVGSVITNSECSVQKVVNAHERWGFVTLKTKNFSSCFTM